MLGSWGEEGGLGDTIDEHLEKHLEGGGRDGSVRDTRRGRSRR